ncbi:MAG: Asp-tRNA(Asn)/Glu-tRNA(Gln) amidotransferase subunit GatA [Candidatus Bathyarchaeia archaeon]
MPKLHKLTAKETVEKIRSKEVTAEERVLSIFKRIHAVEDRLHAFITIVEKEALRKARAIDEKVSEGKPIGRLAGVPIAVKDNICTKGIRTTCSSRMLENFVPPYDATVIEKIKREDGVIIGKTNMDEFAMGSSTETSYFGPTHNPWDPSRVPGGSSGGSAAALVADETILAFGADTGGSIRCPASYCSVVGIKPTYGLVSRYGLIAYANSLEQIGPMAKNVYDCALFLSVIAGHDPKDSTSVKVAPKDYTEFLRNGVEDFKIGVPAEFFAEGTSENVEKEVWRAIHKLEELGASCEETSLPSLEYALATYYIVAMSEASSNLARYDGLRYGYRVDRDDGDWSTVYSRSRRVGFGAEVRRRIILGTYALSAGYYDKYYLKALKIRTLIRRDFDAAFKKFSVLIGPTMPIPPFKIGEKIQDPLALYMCDVDTVSANLAGLPAISIPCGFTDGLPIGMQIIAPPLREDLMLQVAYTFEQNTAYKDRKPSLK